MSLLFSVYRCLFSPRFHCCLVSDGVNRTCLLTVSESLCVPGQQPIMMSHSGTVITTHAGRGALCAGVGEAGEHALWMGPGGGIPAPGVRDQEWGRGSKGWDPESHRVIRSS